MSGQFNDNANIESLAMSLKDSYFAYPRIQNINSNYMPSRKEIYSITESLFELVFPGYFGPQQIKPENVQEFIQNHLQEISQLLYHQIYQCLIRTSDGDEQKVGQSAKLLVNSFLETLSEVRAILASDILSAYKGDPAAQDTDEVIFSYPATVAIGTYRLAHELWKLKVPLIPRIMTEHAHNLTGIDIHPGARIGRGFFIDHGTGVVIGETAIVGDNCKLYQGVTLGAASFPHDDHGQIIRGHKRHPTLEDDVVVYSNSSILGNVTIGKGASILGSVFLTRSVPPGSTVSPKRAELRYRHGCDALSRGYVSDYEI